jgi:hypothetical protein
MTIDALAVAERVTRIRERIAALSDRSVQLIAVTKTFGYDAIDAAVHAHCDGVGENYAQELLAKVEGQKVPIPVHFIGGLQSNKVRQLAPVVDVWQTIDRESVLLEVAKRAPGAAVLIQVNTTNEPSKGGCTPTAAEALVSLGLRSGLTVRGLMTIGPTDGTIAECESAFTQLRNMADSLGLEECSMGMTSDYESAVSCGSTIVRIGSALFGLRQ